MKNSFLYILLGLVLVYSFVFLFTQNYFITVDGPSHLYNSNILSKIFDNDQFISMYYSHVSEVVPNYFSTYLLLILNKIFHPLVSEKILILIYFILFNVSLGLVLTKSSKTPSFYLLFLTPLAFNYLLGFGFYNFIFGVCFLLFTIYFYLECIEKNRVYLFVILTIFMYLTFVSHGLLFLLELAILFFILFIKYLEDWLLFRKINKSNLLQLIKLSVIAFPGSYFLFAFIDSRKSINEIYLSTYEIIEYISELRPLIIYTHLERMYSKEYFYLFFALVVVSTQVWFLKSKFTPVAKVLSDFRWFVLAIICLILMFFLPDSTNGGGFVIVRIQLLFIIFCGIWMSTIEYNKWSYIVCLILCFIPFYKSIEEKHNIQSGLNLILSDFRNAENLIKPNTVILPIRTSDNWLDTHFSNYLGLTKSVLILENYEASTGYFPIIFKNPNNQCVRLPFHAHDEINKFPIKICQENESIPIDYIVFYGKLNLNSNQKEFLDSTEMYFNRIYNSDYVQLFQLKDKH